MKLNEEFNIFIYSMWALYNLYIIDPPLKNIYLIIRQRAYNCFLIRPSDFIADCCVQARCKRHNIDWLAVEQSTLSSSEPGCNTQRLRHMIYWKPTDRHIRMTSHPCLRNPVDAQDVSAFLHHLIKAFHVKELAYFHYNELNTVMKYSNIDLKKNYL